MSAKKWHDAASDMPPLDMAILARWPDGMTGKVTAAVDDDGGLLWHIGDIRKQTPPAQWRNLPASKRRMFLAGMAAEPTIIAVMLASTVAVILGVMLGSAFFILFFAIAVVLLLQGGLVNLVQASVQDRIGGIVGMVAGALAALPVLLLPLAILAAITLHYMP